MIGCNKLLSHKVGTNFNWKQLGECNIASSNEWMGQIEDDDPSRKADSRKKQRNKQSTILGALKLNCSLLDNSVSQRGIFFCYSSSSLQSGTSPSPPHNLFSLFENLNLQPRNWFLIESVHFKKPNTKKKSIIDKKWHGRALKKQTPQSGKFWRKHIPSRANSPLN